MSYQETIEILESIREIVANDPDAILPESIVTMRQMEDNGYVWNFHTGEYEKAED